MTIPRGVEPSKGQVPMVWFPGKKEYCMRSASATVLLRLYYGRTTLLLRLSYAAAMLQLRWSYAVDTEDQQG
jgi:hypothetical protein